MNGEVVIADLSQFVEEEFLGVQGVRCQELFERWDGDRDVLTEAVREIATRRRYKDGYYFEWKPWSELEADTALRRLLGYTDWIEFFADLCDDGADRLRAQVWQFKDELAERGVRELHRSAVEDALLEFAAAFLPDSAAGSEDYRSLFSREAVTWLDERGGYAVVAHAFGGEVAEEVDEAWQLDIPKFRAFLRGRVREALKFGVKEQ